MKVRIDAGGREVEIECGDANVTADTIGDKALAIWQATGGAAEVSEGPAYGFSAQLANGRAPTSSMRRWDEVAE